MASPDPLTTALTPSHITLLLKHHKSAVLLPVLPSTTITDIKTLLFAALRSRGVFTFPSTKIPLPISPDDLELGVLFDKRDMSKGFELLVEDGEEEDTKSKKGKGRLSKGAKGAGDTAEGVGLGDGSWVAYRLRKGGGMKDDGDEEADMVVGVDEAGWDVVVPSLEEVDAEKEMKGEDIEVPDVPNAR